MKKPRFGTKIVNHEGTVLEYDYIVPGYTLHDLVLIYDKATKEPGLSDLAAYPSKWPNVHALQKVINIVIEALDNNNDDAPKLR